MSNSNISVSSCANCPFAVYLGESPLGDRYKCTAWGNAHQMGGVVRGHWTPDDECQQELEKARDKQNHYANHHLNSKESAIAQSNRSLTNPESLEWFEDWQEESNHQMQVSEYVILKSEMVVSQSYSQSMGISLQVMVDIPCYIAVWDDTENHPTKICDVYVQASSFVARRSHSWTDHQGSTLVEAISSLVEEHFEDKQPLCFHPADLLKAIQPYC